MTDNPPPPPWREIWKMARLVLALKVNKRVASPRFVRWIAGEGNRIVIHFGVRENEEEPCP